MRIVLLLVVAIVLGAGNTVSASYGGFTLDELTLSADIVVLARITSAPISDAKHRTRRAPTKVIQTWKGSNVPTDIVIEYDPEEAEAGPQFDVFGTKHNFIAFLSRKPGERSTPPVYEMHFGADGVLPVWNAGDLCGVGDVVTAPHGLRRRGLRYLDVRGVKAHVSGLAQLQEQNRLGVPVVPSPGEVLSPVQDWSNMRLYSCRCALANPSPGRSGVITARVETCQPDGCDPAAVCRDFTDLTRASECTVNLPPRNIDLGRDSWTCQTSEVLPCGMRRGPTPKAVDKAAPIRQ